MSWWLSRSVAPFALIVAGSTAAAAPNWPGWVDFSRWTDINEDYRAQFADCDTRNVFRGLQMNRKHAGKYYYGCSSDPSRVTVLRKLAPADGLPEGAVAYTSKLSVDLDGSWYACNTPGKTDQCPTSLSLKGAGGKMIPVSSERVAYVAIPVRGPTKELSREFATLTGIGQGDFGVVVTPGGAIPVIVADGGPFSKLGEGSIELHRRLGQELCKVKDAEGRCREVIRPLRSLPGPIVTIIIPNSRRSDVTAANVEAVTKSEGERIWQLIRPALGR